MKAVQEAFDIFEGHLAGNEVLTSELERMLNSLGYYPTVAELRDLSSQIDRRGTGFMEYNSFMSVSVPFLRKHYHSFDVVSLQRLKVCGERRK